MALQDDTLLNYVHVFMFCCLLRSYFHIFAKIHQHAICISSHVNKRRICHFSTKSEAFLIITGRGDLTTLNSQSQILFLIFSFTKSSPYLFFYIDNFAQNTSEEKCSISSCFNHALPNNSCS